MSNEADLSRYKGKLKDKIVLTTMPRELPMSMTPLAHRFTSDELLQRSLTPDPSRGGFGGGPGPNPTGPPPNPAEARRFRERLVEFLREEQPLVVLQYTTTADGGTVFGSSGGSFKAGDPIPPPTVVLTPEHYNRIVRLIEHKIPVKLEFDIRAQVGESAETHSISWVRLQGAARKTRWSLDRWPLR